MEMKYCALLLLALSVYYNAEATLSTLFPDQPSLDYFDIEAGGRYVASGKVRFTVQYPVEVPPSDPTDASFGIDPVNKVATFLFPPHYQFQLENNFYYGDSTIGCFIVPNATYNDYVFKYRQLIHWDTNLLQKSWGGLVKDPAFVGWYGSLQAQTNLFNRLTSVAFAQTLAPGGVATKVFGVFTFKDYTTFLPYKLPPAYTNLPAACGSATVIDYASVWYPPTFNQRALPF